MKKKCIRYENTEGTSDINGFGVDSLWIVLPIAKVDREGGILLHDYEL